MFFKAVYHIWKSDFSVLGYRGLKSIFPDGASFLWSSCSQTACWIFHRETKSKNFIGYCLRKVYWNILHCRLGRISTNAVTHVVHHLYFFSEPLDLYSWLPNPTDTFAKTNMMNKGNLPLALLHEQAVILFRFYAHSWKIGCNDDNDDNADSDDDDDDHLQWFMSCRV